jgi:hypothetical protein
LGNLFCTSTYFVGFGVLGVSPLLCAHPKINLGFYINKKISKILGIAQ